MYSCWLSVGSRCIAGRATGYIHHLALRGYVIGWSLVQVEGVTIEGLGSFSLVLLIVIIIVAFY